MPSTPDPAASWAAIVGRAALYALLIVLLVLFAPAEQQSFIYMGF
jgi:hypothetical protein